METITRFTIYEGNPKPLRVRGKHCCRMAMFAEKYRGWHSAATDRTTQRAPASLVRLGAVIVNEFGQFKWHC